MIAFADPIFRDKMKFNYPWRKPTDIAATIPEGPVEPVILKMSVVKSSVAIVMPDTGLFELPTRPTILDETAPKKNPNITTNSAPGSDMGTCGMKHIKRITATIPAATRRRRFLRDKEVSHVLLQ